MTGPRDLTFNGIVAWGCTTHYFAGHDEISLGFSGQWSNGLSAYGEVHERWWTDQVFDVEPSLYTSSTTVAPEPGSLILLGSGVLGLAAVLRP